MRGWAGQGARTRGGRPRRVRRETAGLSQRALVFLGGSLFTPNAV